MKLTCFNFFNEIENQFTNNESDLFYMFKNFVNEIENQFSKKIKRLRSDKRIEYDSGLLNEFHKHGIIHEHN